MDKTAINMLFEKLSKDAASSGYFVNPDRDFAMELAESLLVNRDRYGYDACPCRLAEGKRKRTST